MFIEDIILSYKPLTIPLCFDSVYSIQLYTLQQYNYHTIKIIF